MTDHTNSLPDECLALIFNNLTTTNDRNSSSLVSHRWLRVEAQTRRHLTLKAHSNLQPFIPSIFNRFNSLTQLVLSNNRASVSINDNDIILISSMSPNLTRLILSGCNQLTDSGMFELLHNCSHLEVLFVNKMYSCLPHVGAPANFRAVNTIKVVELRRVCSERLFEPLISGFKNLRILKLICCGGKWDRTLEMIPDDSCLVEVHLEKVNVTDVGLSSLSKCRYLNSLRIGNSHCTDVGLIRVAENCKGLTKLYVGQLNRIWIGDEGLIVVGKHSVNLQELFLIGVDATCDSLQVIATNCRNLVRLELSRSETITDVEMVSIAEKCISLKILRIEMCRRVSNKGIEAFALGCPNLAEIRVIKCYKVTREVKDWLIARRGGQFKCM